MHTGRGLRDGAGRVDARRSRRRGPWAFAWSLVLVLALAGCGTVEVTEPDGTRRVHLHLGPVSLTAPPGGTVVGRMSALGLARTPTGTALGYVSEEVTVVAEDCRVLVWVPSAAEARAAREALADLGRVCAAVSPPAP